MTNFDKSVLIMGGNPIDGFCVFDAISRQILNTKTNRLVKPTKEELHRITDILTTHDYNIFHIGKNVYIKMRGDRFVLYT